MHDMLGVEIKKGDLLLSISGSNGSFYSGICVAVDFTKAKIVIGPPKEEARWSSGAPNNEVMVTKRPMVIPHNSIIINHLWDITLSDLELMRERYNHPKILEIIKELNITPNNDDIRKPISITEEMKEQKTKHKMSDTKDDLENI